MAKLLRGCGRSYGTHHEANSKSGAYIGVVLAFSQRIGASRSQCSTWGTAAAAFLCATLPEWGALAIHGAHSSRKRLLLFLSQTRRSGLSLFRRLLTPPVQEIGFLEEPHSWHAV